MRELQELPAGWVWASLGELLTSIETGKSFKCDERPPRVDEVGVIKVSAVTWGEYREQESKTCTDPDRINPSLFVRPGDFLFSRANTIELVGACVIARQVGLSSMLSDKILRFCFALDSMKPWVLHFLRSKAGRQQIESLASGNQESMRNIGQERIGQIRLPLPPTAEQTRIVAKLDELLSGIDAGVAELKTAQRKLQRYRQSLLKAAVEGALTADWRRAHPPTETGADLLARILRERRTRWEHQQLARYTTQQKPPPKGWQDKYPETQAPKTTDLWELPDGWVWARLGQLLAGLTSGSRDWAPYYDRGNCVFVMAQNVRPWRPDFSFRQMVDPPLDDRDRARSEIRRDDLLVTIVGANTGQSCRVPSALVDHFVCQSVALLRPVDETMSEYLNAVLNSDGHGQLQFREMNYGAGRPHLSFEQLESVMVPLPPMAEQAQILAVLAENMPACEELSSLLDRMQKQSAAQRQNLLRAAFRGELTPQDPADEPASRLLARLRAERAEAPTRGTRKPRSTA